MTLSNKLKISYSNSLVKLVMLEINAFCGFELLVEDAQPGNDIGSFEAVAAVYLGGCVGRVQRLAKKSSLRDVAKSRVASFCSIKIFVIIIIRKSNIKMLNF